MELAAKAIGFVAQSYGNLTANYVEFELKRAFEWLTDRSEINKNAKERDELSNKRLAAVRNIFYFR